MIQLISVIHLLNNNRDAVKILTNSKSLSSIVTANAEKHPEGYLVNNSLLKHLYHQKVLHLINEDSEEDLFAIDYLINLIESRPFTTFLYKEKVFND